MRHIVQHPFRVAALIACVGGIPVTAGSQQTSGIRGFTSPHAVEERQREKALQALPSPENLREYMKAISAEPHHAGSAGSRKVADYVLGKFKLGSQRFARAVRSLDAVSHRARARAR